MELNFKRSKKDLLRAFEIYSEFAKAETDAGKFNRNWKDWPESLIRNFLDTWKQRESEVLERIAEEYHPWAKGQVEIWLFPNKEMLSDLPEPYSSITYTFRGLDKVYVSLFFVNEKIPYRLLIHELFHANDMLRGQQGRSISEEKHKWFEETSQKIAQDFFGT